MTVDNDASQAALDAFQRWPFVVLRYLTYVIEGVVLTPLLTFIAVLMASITFPGFALMPFLSVGWKITGSLVLAGGAIVEPLLAVLHDRGHIERLGHATGIMGMVLMTAASIYYVVSTIIQRTEPYDPHFQPFDFVWILFFFCWLAAALLGTAYTTGRLGARWQTRLHARVRRSLWFL